MFGGGGWGEAVGGVGGLHHICQAAFLLTSKGTVMARWLHTQFIFTLTCVPTHVHSTLSGSPFIFKDLCCHFYVATMLLALVGRSREIKKSLMIKRVILASASLHASVALGIVLIYLELRLYLYLDA